MSLQIQGAGAGQGIFGWWSAEEVICSRGGPGTSNHGKDKKGLHPFACWSTCGPLPGQIRVLCSSAVGRLKMEHEGSWSPDV